MKKVLLLLLVSVGLVACGNDDVDDVVQQAEDEAPDDVTGDPLELAMDSNYTEYSGETDDFDITRYTSDEANDDGLIELDVEGYKIKFNVVAGESQYGDEDMILIVGEQENTNDDGGEMQMNRYEMKTSEGEKLDDGWNYSSVEPGMKDKVANEFGLEYDIPDEIELHVDSVYEEGEGQHEVDKTYTFHKE